MSDTVTVEVRHLHPDHVRRMAEVYDAYHEAMKTHGTLSDEAAEAYAQLRAETLLWSETLGRACRNTVVPA